MKSHTRFFFAFLLAGSTLVLIIVTMRPASIAQSSRQRQIDDAIPKHLPIKVKLKAEKEAKFKDLNNSDWTRDFVLEVTNTSDKPIYYLEFWLELPETKSENNIPLAFFLRYGRADFIRYETRPNDTDIPLQPGETAILAIGEDWQQGWREFKLRGNVPDPEKVKLKFIQLSFEDGSGFNSGGEAYPYKRQSSTENPLTNSSRGV